MRVYAFRVAVSCLLATALSCAPRTTAAPGASTASRAPSVSLPTRASAPGERHLRNLRQLTNGGENAEAYFSADGRRLVFQSTRDGRTCDQQYVMNVDGTGVRRVSTGTGKTTCGFFYANDERILFGSSHALQQACPREARSVEGLRVAIGSVRHLHRKTGRQ